jgi:LysM repeat protein
MNHFIKAAGLITCWACCGCITMFDDMQTEQARSRMEAESLRVSTSRLNEKVAGLQQAQEQMFRDIADLRRQIEQADAAGDTRRADVESRLKATEQAWEKGRQEIIDALSKRIADVMNRQSREQPLPVTGYEHVVKTGETLSEIARTYGVSMSAVVQANNLPNPDSIRVGQKLFIPGTAGAR